MNQEIEKLEQKITKLEKEIEWINKTKESLSLRKKHKLEKVMNLMIQKRNLELTKKENQS